MSKLHPSMRKFSWTLPDFKAFQCPICAKNPDAIPLYRPNRGSGIGVWNCFAHPHGTVFTGQVNLVYKHIRYAHRMRHTDAVQLLAPLIYAEERHEAKLVNLDDRISKQMQGDRIRRHRQGRR